MKESLTLIRPLSVLGLAASLFVFASASSSRNTMAFLGSSDENTWPVVNNFVSAFDPNGGYVSASGSAEFTGLDHNGDEQTSYFGGLAHANLDYGMLKTYVNASLENTFYNDSNVDNGIPNIYIAAAQAQFNDTLHFSGTYLLSSFKIRYTYFVHGYRTDSAYGSLSVDVGTNHESLYLGYGSGPNIAQYFSTQSYSLNADMSQDIRTNFLAGFQIDTQYYLDGSNFVGEADFASTITLSNIEVFDDAGNPFYDWTLTSDSGFQYPTANAVPEPASMAALGFGALAVLRRRKRS